MVTIESEMFTEVATALRERFEGIYVSGEYLMKPPSYPAVSIEEADNYDATGEMTTEGSGHSVVTYEINVYTNKTVGKKTQAKEIMAVINGVMMSRNFSRLSSIPVPNVADISIYRITARYRAETDGKTIYRYSI